MDPVDSNAKNQGVMAPGSEVRDDQTPSENEAPKKAPGLPDEFKSKAFLAGLPVAGAIGTAGSNSASARAVDAIVTHALVAAEQGKGAIPATKLVERSVTSQLLSFLDKPHPPTNKAVLAAVNKHYGTALGKKFAEQLKQAGLEKAPLSRESMYQLRRLVADEVRIAAENPRGSPVGQVVEASRNSALTFNSLLKGSLVGAAWSAGIAAVLTAVIASLQSRAQVKAGKITSEQAWERTRHEVAIAVPAAGASGMIGSAAGRALASGLASTALGGVGGAVVGALAYYVADKCLRAAAKNRLHWN